MGFDNTVASEVPSRVLDVNYPGQEIYVFSRTLISLLYLILKSQYLLLLFLELKY